MSGLNPNKAERIDELLAAMIEGGVGALDELEDLLRDDPAAQLHYLRQRDLHEALRWATDADASRQTMQSMRAEALGESKSAVAGRVGAWRVAIAVAALIAVAGGAVGLYFVVGAGSSGEPIGPPPIVPIATLIESTGGTLTTPDGYPRSGHEYGPGDYVLDGGRAEFVLTNRVTVALRGETRLRMRSPSRMILSRGTAEFNVPSGAIGFTVDTPGGARVVDLGTAFAVGIRPDGSAEVAVTEGRVRVEYSDTRAEMVPDGAVYRIDEQTGGVEITEPLAIDPSILARTRSIGSVDDLRLDDDGWRRAYALNMGAAGEARTVRGVTFDGSETLGGIAGVSVASDMAADPWTNRTPEFGDSEHAAAFESIMSSIRWGSERSAVRIDLDVTAGHAYRLTLLLSENHFDVTGERAFDIVVEGLRLRDEFDVLAAAEGPSRVVAVEYEFVARDDTLNIELLGGKTAEDGNPILNALTLLEMTPTPPADGPPADESDPLDTPGDLP